METASDRSSYGVAIETSGRRGSVALARGAEVLREVTFSGDLRHAVELLPSLDALCRGCGIAADEIRDCYVSGGPGSFTGVRIGMTVARTLGVIASVRVVRVPTLDVIAQNALQVADRPEHVGVVLDAKRGHVYAGAYRLCGDRYEPTTDPAEIAPRMFFMQLPRPAALIGEGCAFVSDAVAEGGLQVLPEDLHRARAGVVHRLGYARAVAGDFDDPMRLIPIYVRRPEAEEVWEKRRRDRS